MLNDNTSRPELVARDETSSAVLLGGELASGTNIRMQLDYRPFQFGNGRRSRRQVDYQVVQVTEILVMALPSYYRHNTFVANVSKQGPMDRALSAGTAFETTSGGLAAGPN
jgi:hypothetical protein